MGVVVTLEGLLTSTDRDDKFVLRATVGNVAEVADSDSLNREVLNFFGTIVVVVQNSLVEDRQ